MFEYFWIVVVLLVYVPWTFWTLIDFVRISLEYLPLSVENISDAFNDWFGEHEAWVYLHFILLILLMAASFAYWVDVTFV